MATGNTTYYEILEIDQNAPQHEITAAYERAKKTYSGENPAIYTIFSQEEARDYLKLIEESYAVIGNKILRSIYDKRLYGKNSAEDLTYASIVKASQALFPENKKVERPKVAIDEVMEKEIRDKKDWTGSDLKKIREYRGISLEKMAQITKINSYYLHALEEMNPKNLPAFVFVRGYVIQVVKELGLDPKTVTESYLKNFKSHPLSQ